MFGQPTKKLWRYAVRRVTTQFRIPISYCIFVPFVIAFRRKRSVVAGDCLISRAAWIGTFAWTIASLGVFAKEGKLV